MLNTSAHIQHRTPAGPREEMTLCSAEIAISAVQLPKKKKRKEKRTLIFLQTFENSLYEKKTLYNNY